jgi:hypothetical protein
VATSAGSGKVIVTGSLKPVTWLFEVICWTATVCVVVVVVVTTRPCPSTHPQVHRHRGEATRLR